jgi:hypothetical protein
VTGRAVALALSGVRPERKLRSRWGFRAKARTIFPWA